MVAVENKLSKFPATQTYVDFGLAQVEAINTQYDQWFAQQAFSEEEGFSRFEKLIVDGHSDYDGPSGRGGSKPYDDNIQWDLRFGGKVENKGLSDQLLHVTTHQKDRRPNVTTFNSAPQIFDTADYFQLGVANGERGWVKEGTFPVNVHMTKRFIDNNDLSKGTKNVPIQTDVRREAEAGFRAALEWQKFRSMAAASSDYLVETLKGEWAALEPKDRHGASQIFRDRKEQGYELFLSLLPDTQLEEGPTALKTSYQPGALEGAFALGLQDFKGGNMHRTKAEERPIYLVSGKPIEITSKEESEGYDARINFEVELYGSHGLEEPEEVKQEVETILKQHFDLTATDATKYRVSFELKDAHLVDRAILEGRTDTELHQFIQGFGGALQQTYQAVKDWHETKRPGLRQNFEAAVILGREDYFAKGLGASLASNGSRD
jgi:hypothetical protein